MRSQEYASVCPKCGYDQSGEIQTWSDRCPVHGTCPECGLGFAWAHVMRPGLAQVSWYVEHAKSVRGFVGRSIQTPIQLLLPHRFWKQLDPTKPVSISRLVLWAMLLIFVVHTLVAVPNGYNAWIRSNWSGYDFPAHVELHGGYAIAELIFDGYCYPYFDALPEPSSHKWTLRVERGWDDGWMDFLIATIMTGTGMLIAWVVIMFAIPQTRRLAKLRKRHVVRAVIISAVMIMISYEATMVLMLLYDLRWFSRDVYRVLDSLPRLVCWVWLLWFWGCAIHRGWLIRPSKLLIVLGCVASVLGGLTLSTYVYLASTA